MKCHRVAIASRSSCSTPGRVLRAAVALAGVWLVGCGGSGSSEPTPTYGTVDPPITGLTFVELSNDGTVLQRSSKTDVSGRFGFARPLEGRRIESLAPTGGLRVARLSSAPVRQPGQTAIEVSPASTALDQLIEAGAPRKQAETTLKDLTSSECGPDAVLYLQAALAGSVPVADDRGAWLQRSLRAYLDALGSIGVSSISHRSTWSERLTRHAGLLGQMCKASAALYADTWLAETQTWIAAQGGTPSVAALTLVRPKVTEQMLGLMQPRIAPMEYPALASLSVAGDALQAPGQEAELARRLAFVLATRQPAPVESKSASVAPYTITTGYGLSAQGDLVAVQRAAFESTSFKTVALQLDNTTASDQAVELRVNGLVLNDPSSLLLHALAMQRGDAEEPLHRRLWRYVIKTTRHDYPVSSGRFIHRSPLFISSLGRGLCDDMATVLYNLWRAAGYPARIWGLNGHVVPEVWVDGRWEVYDSDYGLYYHDREGRIAGAEQLSQDPALLTDPVDPVAAAWNSGYSSVVAALYGSVEDNAVATWFMREDAAPAPAPALLLPKGARLQVVAAADYAQSSIEDGFASNYARLELWLPPGFAGSVATPLVLADVRGDGAVELLGQQTELGSTNLSETLKGYYRSVPDAQVDAVHVDRSGSAGVTLTMLVNPLLIDELGLTAISVKTPSLASIPVSYPSR